MIRKLLLAIIFMIPMFASAAECSLYEQAHPAFLLDGAHLSSGKCNTCASCHRSGVFIGTPKNCVSCHNGDPTRITIGRPSTHIPSLLTECSNCHNTTAFTAYSMNHTSVSTFRCDSCHNATYSPIGVPKKPGTHIPTTADCGTCHATSSWQVSHTQVHAGIVTGCVSCHDNVFARGKASYAPGHPLTSDQCETCHSIDAAFKCAQAYDIMINYASMFYRKAIWTIKNMIA